MGDKKDIVDPFSNAKDPKMLTFDQVKAARQAIEGGVVKTSCNKSRMSEFVNMNIYLKNEFMQYTGSFKERGARSALLNLTPEQKKIGAVSASSGNHALAMCYQGKVLGVSVTIIMPVTAAIMKIQKCKQFGAEVIVEGKDLQESKILAMKLAEEKGAVYINGYDHPDVLAGQGTLGIEILEQLPTTNAVIVPVGGGGLLAGIAVAIKALKPCTKVIGVESENCLGFANSLQVGEPIMTEVQPTIADGLAVPLVGYNSVHTAKKYVDKMISVKEDDIAVAILRLIENEKLVVEGAGASPLAAVLAGQLNEFRGKNVVLILSGGNIDTTVLSRCLERGLASDGRLVKAYVQVTDRPGSAAELCGLIASLGVSIKHVQQERAWITFDVFSVQVKAVCETRDFEHALELEKILKEHYDKVDLVHAEFPASSNYKN